MTEVMVFVFFSFDQNIVLIVYIGTTRLIPIYFKAFETLISKFGLINNEPLH